MIPQNNEIPNYATKIILGDLNAKIGKEHIFKPTIGNHSLHNTSNDKGIRLINFAISKELVIKSTMYPHKDIHKATWVSPDLRTKNQIDHILINNRRKSSITDIRTFRGADIGSDHYLLIAKLKERISVVKTNKSLVNKINIEQLKIPEKQMEYMQKLEQILETNKQNRSRNEC